jgi:hypothetical protein
MSVRILLSVVCISTAVAAAEKPTISYKPASSGEEDRPVMTRIVAGAQGTDYAFKLDFDKLPWGADCKTHCANATLFIDADNNKTTGLKLADEKAAETGADLVITIQGTRTLDEGAHKPILKVKVAGYSETATSVEEAEQIAELDPVNDSERVLSSDNSVYLLIDGNSGNIPTGKMMRVIYHPPGSKPLSGTAKGLASPTSQRVELFKDGKLTNPVVKKKSVYEKF